MIKKSRQKFKYLDNEKSFYDELKSIFHQFQSAFSEANKTFFFLLGGGGSGGGGGERGGGGARGVRVRLGVLTMKRHLLFRSRICKYLTPFSNITNRAFKMFSSKPLPYFCHVDFIRNSP